MTLDNLNPPQGYTMVFEGQGFITTAWWITAFPGIAIVILALGFSLFGDGLGELLGAGQ